MSDISVDELRLLSEYSRLPYKLKRAEVQEKPDVFGAEDRLAAIKHVLHGEQLGVMADLGGNSGYFSLSLLDAGMATKATIYDLGRKELEIGRVMAQKLGVDEKIEFVEQAISLDFLRSMPSVDTMICLNLIHHSGSVFDLEAVQSQGWGHYASEWLEASRARADFLIFGVGFKGLDKPAHWGTPLEKRARELYQRAERAGWKVMYDANVEDIHRLGVAEANGLRTLKDTAARRLARRVKTLPVIRQIVGSNSKRDKYHLYLMRA